MRNEKAGALKKHTRLTYLFENCRVRKPIYSPVQFTAVGGKALGRAHRHLCRLRKVSEWVIYFAKVYEKPPRPPLIFAF